MSPKCILGEDGSFQKVEDIISGKLLKESRLVSISIKTQEIKGLDEHRGKHTNYTL